jgi:hypothetical protein
MGIFATRAEYEAAKAAAVAAALLQLAASPDVKVNMK